MEMSPLTSGEAEATLVRLNTSGSALAGAEALARLLLRAESVASSRIEGLVIGGRRLDEFRCSPSNWAKTFSGRDCPVLIQASWAT